MAEQSTASAVYLELKRKFSFIKNESDSFHVCIKSIKQK